MIEIIKIDNQIKVLKTVGSNVYGFNAEDLQMALTVKALFESEFLN